MNTNMILHYLGGFIMENFIKKALEIQDDILKTENG